MLGLGYIAFVRYRKPPFCSNGWTGLNKNWTGIKTQLSWK